MPTSTSCASSEQSYQAVDPIMDHGEALANIPTSIGQYQPASNISIQGSPVVSSTCIQTPEGPDTGGGTGLTSTDSKPTLPLPLRESLGFSGLIALIGGYLGIIGVLAFLTFLWFGYGSAPEAANASRAWRQIALSNWMARAITLSSLAIRLLITFQATVCTSMIAALILEKRHARKSCVPWISVMRSINDGPYKLVEVLLSSKSRTIVCHPEFWLATLMVVTTLALQFSSTVLLSDLHSSVIISDHNQTQIPSLISYNKTDFAVQLTGFEYLLKPPTFSTFGEVQSTSDVSPNSDGLSDTGLLQRGFLPFSGSDNRTSVRKYNGNTIIMNSRAACMRPVIDAGYRYTNDSGNFEGSALLEGQLQYTSSLQQAQVDSESLCGSGECEELPFSCDVPSSAYGQWEAATCQLNRFGMQPHSLTLQPYWTPADGLWSANSSTQLVLSTNLRDEDWSNFLDTQSLTAGKFYQEWQSYELLPGRFLNLTLCFMGVELERKFVEMNTSSDLHEPVIVGSPTSRTYSTTDVQNLFGVDGLHKSAAERGTLDMIITGDPEDGPASSRAYETITVGDAENITIAKFTPAIMELVLYAQAITVVGANTTLPFCSFCSIVAEMMLNPKLSVVLNDIIVQSGRAADALLTYLTIIASQVYYDYLEALTEFQEVDIIMTTIVLVPGRCSSNGCRGFISVTTLLVVHLLYVAIITSLYIRQVRYSRYANIWYTASQLVSGELKEALEQGNNTSDKVIIKAIRNERKDDPLHLGPIDANGQIGFSKGHADISVEARSSKPRLARLKEKLQWKVRKDEGRRRL